MKKEIRHFSNSLQVELLARINRREPWWKRLARRLGTNKKKGQ